MDKNVSRHIGRINEEVAKKYEKDLFKKSRPFQLEKEVMEKVARGSKNSATARGATKMIESGMYDRESMDVDEKVGKKLEAELEYKLRQAIRKGVIPPAKLDAQARRLIEKAKRDE